MNVYTATAFHHGHTNAWQVAVFLLYELSLQCVVVRLITFLNIYIMLFHHLETLNLGVHLLNHQLGFVFRSI